MNNPLPTKVIPLNKLPNQPVQAALNEKVSLTVNQVVDSKGKPFSGKINLKSSTCDSLNEPEKLKSLPPLLIFNSNDGDEPPTSKLVSFSMQTHQF
jgi:hypothetical protein